MDSLLSTSISIDTKTRLSNMHWCFCMDVNPGYYSQHGGQDEFATSCYRIMLYIKRLDREKNTQIHEMTNTQPLINTIRQRQLRFLTPILRTPEDEPFRRYALFLSNHGRRRPGRQRTSYISHVQKLLGLQKELSASRRHCFFSY